VAEIHFFNILFISVSLIGCTKEAKKERHWGRREKYFSENKFKEAFIEFKMSFRSILGSEGI
jgi:hypothetical protein